MKALAELAVLIITPACAYAVLVFIHVWVHP